MPPFATKGAMFPGSLHPRATTKSRTRQRERFESDNATAFQGLSHSQELHGRELQDSAAASTVTTPAIAKAAATTTATVTSAATLPARGGFFAQCLMPK